MLEKPRHRYRGTQPERKYDRFRRYGCDSNSFGTNSTVKQLNIACTDIADKKVREALSHLLCDETSFDSTRMSNHTLNTIRWKDKPLDKDLGHGIASYLKMNRNRNKLKVARQKSSNPCEAYFVSYSRVYFPLHCHGYAKTAMDYVQCTMLFMHSQLYF